MGQTYTARQTARDVQSALAKVGVTRDVDAKRVRAWVRDNVDAYDDDGYTAHLYDSKTHAAIVSAMVARYTGKGAGTNGRAAAASAGRPKPSAKPSATRGRGTKPTQTMASDQTPDA